MVVRQPALFMQARVDHDAENLRRWVSALFSDRPGFFGINDFVVSQRSGGSDRSVDVAGGRAMIEGESATYQGMYFVENRGPMNLPLAPADATNGRKDLIVARLFDEAYPDGTSGSPWDIVAIQGVPDPSPVVPSRPSNSLVLAEVTVPSLAARNPTVINNADIVSKRIGLIGFPGGTTQVNNAAERTAITDAYPGLLVREMDTGRTYEWSGSIWRYLHGGDDPTYVKLSAESTTLVLNVATKVGFTVDSGAGAALWDAGTDEYVVPRAGLLQIATTVKTNLTAANGRQVMTCWINGAEAFHGGDLPVVGSNTRPGPGMAVNWPVAAGNRIAIHMTCVGAGATCYAGPSQSWATFRMVP